MLYKIAWFNNLGGWGSIEKEKKLEEEIKIHLKTIFGEIDPPQSFSEIVCFPWNC